jgi:hypothetical protein
MTTFRLYTGKNHYGRYHYQLGFSPSVVCWAHMLMKDDGFLIEHTARQIASARSDDDFDRLGLQYSDFKEIFQNHRFTQKDREQAIKDRIASRLNPAIASMRFKVDLIKMSGGAFATIYGIFFIMHKLCEYDPHKFRC